MSNQELSDILNQINVNCTINNTLEKILKSRKNILDKSWSAEYYMGCILIKFYNLEFEKFIDMFRTGKQWSVLQNGWLFTDKLFNKNINGEEWIITNTKMLFPFYVFIDKRK
jgi:hypothetical protein